MPLPEPGTQWPPKNWVSVFADMAGYAAWWSGDPDQLRNAETRSRNAMGNRRFWNRQNNQPQDRPARSDLHIPLASDLCATSADIVYGAPPSIESKKGADADTTVRIGEYVDDGLIQEMLKGAELGAALGGRYHSVVFDPTMENGRPFITTIRHDHAIPTFQWGRLREVTFWSVISVESATYWRHVEHHQLDETGNGLVIHALYQGTENNIGRQVDLAAHPATAPLAKSVGPDGVLQVRTPGLNVAYIPNVTPNRKWQNQPLAVNLGRSDLEGLSGIFDALDEVYNSWMRDIRLGKARVFADRSMLEPPTVGNPGPNMGAASVLDLDRELFVPLDGIGPSIEGKPLQMQQFEVRWAEHQNTVNDLIARAVRAARYSVATFEDAGSSQMTATEIRARERATATTRDRKIVLEKRGLTALVKKMLTIDTAVTHAPGLAPDNLVISWPDYAQQTVLELAQTAQTLKAANVASLEVLVAMIHPDWDETAVAEEAKKIQAETSTISSPDAWRPSFADSQE